MNLGNRIYENRKKLNLSQEEFAEKLNVTPQTVSKWENGRATPQIEKLEMIADIFGISIDELVTGDKKLESKIKGKRKNIFKLLLKIIIVILILIGLIEIGIYNYRLNIIRRLRDRYMNTYQKIGESYSATITEEYEGKDETGFYEKYKKNYTYYVSPDKSVRKVKIQEYRMEEEKKYGSTSYKPFLVKTTYIDLTKPSNSTEWNFNDVIVVDNLENVYREIDDFEFWSPILETTNCFNEYYGVIGYVDDLAKVVAKNYRHSLNYFIDNDIFTWNYTRDSAGVRLASSVGEVTMFLSFDKEDPENIKGQRSNMLIQMLINENIQEIDVTFNDIEEYTKVD